MKKYFLHNGKEQLGPFSLDDLKQHGLTVKTMVWFEGIANWTEAQFIPELKEFTTAAPPPFEKTNPINQTFDKTKKVFDKDYVNEIENKISNNTGKKVFKYSLFIFAIIGLAFVINLLKPSEARIEKNNPTDFLNLTEAKLEYRGYFGNLPKWRITGKLTNNARFVAYKDVKYEIEFFTRSNTSLGKIELIDYNVFEPSVQNENNKFSFIDIEINNQIPKEVYEANTIIKIIDAAVYKENKTSH